MTNESTTGNSKTCLECGRQLGAGRSDRKYCDDVCRTAFNNRRRYENTIEQTATHDADPEQGDIGRNMQAIKKVQDILFSNRVKLLNIYHIYEDRVSVEDFHRFGVNLKYFTSEHQDDYYGKVFRMCFDYGYHMDGKTVYVIYNGAEIYFN